MCIFKKKEKVWTTNCNDWPDVPGSGARLANVWCPGWHAAQYLKGQEPTVVCDKHAEPPPPPVVPKTKYPYWKYRRAGLWTPDLLTNLIMNDNDIWQEAKLPRLYDAMAKENVVGFRSLLATLDGTSDWNFAMPWKGQNMTDPNPEYDKVIKRRLALVKERDLTAVCCIVPYGGYAMTYSPDFPIYARRMIKLLQPFLPNVIVETVNEPPAGSAGMQSMIVEMCLEEGFPREHIQIAYADASDVSAAIVRDRLEGKGLYCLHWYGTMGSIGAPWPKGWIDSPGSMEQIRYGLYPSNDGADDGSGLDWSWTDKATRSSPQEILEVTRWSLRHENKHAGGAIEDGRGFEHLSASGLRSTGRPDIEAEIEGADAKEERAAIAKALEEVLG